MGGMVGLALLAIVGGALYQDDDRLDEANIVGGGTQNQADGGGAALPADAAPAPGGAIEGFLPRSGEASACREEVGVDLAPGFGARLTINGIDIAPEEMNVNLDGDGNISDVITASRSLGHYTFSPTDACPNGRFLRPVDNRLEVCVFRLSDATGACAFRAENIFDAL